MDYPGKVITKTQVTPTQTSASGNWTLDDQAAAIKNNNWPVALVPNPISKSLRFNSADSAYLNRTPASASNRKTWTWSGWVKRAVATTNDGLIDVYISSTSFTTLYFQNNHTITFQFRDASNNLVWSTAAVFRDPSAWYHVVAVIDTTQASSANTVKIYVNGVQQTVSFTAFSGSYTQNADYLVNSTNSHTIGTYFGGYSNQYLTEINFIDGQALTPSSFGMTNPQTGQWIPLKYSGTYGTNGFYLNFKDATSTTTLGLDYSGNANNWTTNNFSVTAGAGNDSLTDVPTPWFAYNTTGDVGGVFRGNYCTSNPIYKGGDSVLTNGNLNVRAGDSLTSFSCDRGTIAVSSGKWYYEFVQTNIYSTDPPNRAVGWGLTSTLNTTYPGGTGSYSYVYTGDKYNNTVLSAYGASWTTNDVIGLALDLDAGTLVCYKNGVSQGTLASGLSGTFTPIYGRIGNDAGRWIEYVLNFGQRPFAYTPPTGFRSLCTTNLPATAIGFGLTNQGDDYFNAVTYTGNGTGQTISTVGFQPDLVWVKNRNAAGNNHNLQDSVRGFSVALSSSLTNADSAASQAVSGVTSTGFTLGNNSNGYSVNENTYTYVAWNWKAGGTGVSNTAGTVTSTVSANTTAGFSILTYTGNGVDGATTGHGLGVVPNMVIVKRRNTAENWNVKHSSLSSNNVVFLNTTDAQQTPGSGYIGNLTSSTVITLVNGGAAITNVNGNGSTYVAYCFAAVPGYSAFGSYTGNGNSDGPFIYTGFRPKFVMIKGSSVITNWTIVDAARNTSNVTTLNLRPNTSAAETTDIDFDLLSNGFKMRGSGSGGNNSGSTYIYMAFAESPFQFANAR